MNKALNIYLHTETWPSRNRASIRFEQHLLQTPILPHLSQTSANVEAGDALQPPTHETVRGRLLPDGTRSLLGDLLEPVSERAARVEAASPLAAAVGPPKGEGRGGEEAGTPPEVELSTDTEFSSATARVYRSSSSALRPVRFIPLARNSPFSFLTVQVSPVGLGVVGLAQPGQFQGETRRLIQRGALSLLTKISCYVAPRSNETRRSLTSGRRVSGHPLQK